MLYHNKSNIPTDSDSNAEIAELCRRIEDLEKQIEKKPYIIAIQNLNSDKLELRLPIVATVEFNNQGGFTFWSEDLNTWGEGVSEEEAKDNFLLNVEELYFDLKEDKDKLCPALEKVWNFMQKTITEV